MPVQVLWQCQCELSYRHDSCYKIIKQSLILVYYQINIMTTPAFHLNFLHMTIANAKYDLENLRNVSHCPSIGSFKSSTAKKSRQESDPTHIASLTECNRLSTDLNNP